LPGIARYYAQSRHCAHVLIPRLRALDSQPLHPRAQGGLREPKDPRRRPDPPVSSRTARM